MEREPKKEDPMVQPKTPGPEIAPTPAPQVNPSQIPPELPPVHTKKMESY